MFDYSWNTYKFHGTTCSTRNVCLFKELVNKPWGDEVTMSHCRWEGSSKKGRAWFPGSPTDFLESSLSRQDGFSGFEIKSSLIIRCPFYPQPPCCSLYIYSAFIKPSRDVMILRPSKGHAEKWGFVTEEQKQPRMNDLSWPFPCLKTALKSSIDQCSNRCSV